MAQTGNADDVLSTMSGGQTDRRASAHPTLPTSSQTVQGLAQMAISPSIDANMASNAISSGIPITSQAAMQYFAAHPRRQQVHFGNYLLLQTLGEGEFGKVKLGVHKEWGEEVAVKLIKREKVGGDKMRLDISPPGVPPKDPAKMTKVEREIQVLKVRR
jgi:protein-serine/threonine kinase